MRYNVAKGGYNMRKKSHISLARYLVNSKGMEELLAHKKAFYIGSIWPDCTISFIYRRHSKEKTFSIMRKELEKLAESYHKKGINGKFCRHLGIITHYIADYFTYPHNEFYTGSIKDHCIYEKELKFYLREYVKTEEARRERLKNLNVESIDEICELIERKHKEYAKELKIVKQDCVYIVAINHMVVDMFLCYLEGQQRMLKTA